MLMICEEIRYCFLEVTKMDSWMIWTLHFITVHLDTLFFNFIRFEVFMVTMRTGNEAGEHRLNFYLQSYLCKIFVCNSFLTVNMKLDWLCVVLQHFLNAIKAEPDSDSDLDHDPLSNIKYEEPVCVLLKSEPTVSYAFLRLFNGPNFIGVICKLISKYISSNDNSQWVLAGSRIFVCPCHTDRLWSVPSFLSSGSQRHFPMGL
jgi:hypothetical protein